MKLKKWDWLVPVLIMAILLPACPQAPVAPVSQVEAYEPQDIPRYESKIYPGELEVEKAGINYLADFHYAVSVGNELLDARSERLGNGNYTMLDGRYLEPGTIWYLISGAVRAGNGEEIEDVRVVDFSRTMWQRNGPWPYMTLSDPDIYDGIVKYKKDNPDKPVVDCDHNGSGIISSFFGALRRIGSVLINWWIKKNILEAILCFDFNHTIGLAGPVGAPAWCINGPLKSADKAGDALGYQGALEFPMDPGVVKYQYSATIEIHYKKKPVEAKHISGIIALDSDGDGIPDDWEITHGTDPDDPTDPGNGDVYVDVPCVPDLTVCWSEEDVETAFVEAGLVPHFIYESSSEVCEGCYIRSNPPCGTSVLEGSVVDVYISSGQQYVSVPNLVNQLPSDVPGILSPLGLVKDPTPGAPEYSNTIAVGRVVRQWPVATSQVLPGSLVRVALSLGPPPAELFSTPSIYNKTPTEATATLATVNFLLHAAPYEGAYSNTVPAGKFVSQTPAAGEQKPAGTVVTGVISLGPQPPNPLVVTITSPADNFVGTVGQVISFACTVSGGTAPYDNFKWHFPDNSFKYQQNVSKTFDFPGAGWCYIDITDHAGTVDQDKVWVQINAPAKSAYRGPIFWMGQTYEFGSWPAEAKTFLGL